MKCTFLVIYFAPLIWRLLAASWQIWLLAFPELFVDRSGVVLFTFPLMKVRQVLKEF